MFSRLKDFFLGNQHARSERIDISKYSPADIITRDVCIIGGGAAGSYAAIQLQHHGRSVIIIEKESRLGGQTTTYIDPDSNSPVEYGVTWFMDLPVVRDYFAQLEVPVIPSTWPWRMVHYDFRTGEHFPTTKSADDDLKVAFDRYYALMEREYPYLRLGFNLPEPVPADLLLPFDDFVRKHKLESLLPSLGGLHILGNWLRQPTLYVMKYLNMDFVTGVAQGFLKPANRNNSSIYDTVLAKLGTDNVLLRHYVVATDRDIDPCWSYIEVHNEDGASPKQLIRAKRLIIAAPPLLGTLSGLDLSTRETNLFSKFEHTYCYTGVVQIPGLPQDVCYMNSSSDHFMPPRTPNLFVLRPADVPELFTIHFGSPNPLSEDEVRREIIGSVRSFRNITPDIRIVGSHSPFQLRASTEAIADGFYRELNALQGHKRTYYIGAAFESHNSPQIWELTMQLLEKELLPSLRTFT